MRYTLALVMVCAVGIGKGEPVFATNKISAWFSKTSAKFNQGQKKIAKVFAQTATVALLCTGLSCSPPQPPAVTEDNASPAISRADTEMSISMVDNTSLADTRAAIYTLNNWYVDKELRTVLGSNNIGLAMLLMGEESYAIEAFDHDNSTVVIEYNNDVKVILTFDDGPDTRSGAVNGTRKVLNVLEDHDINAVFFIQSHARSNSGNYFRGMEKTVGIPLVERMHDEGHIVAAHTGMDGKRAHAWANRHTRREALGELGKDLDRSKEYIHDRTDAYPRYVRPPFGHYNQAVVKRYASRDLNMILWDIDSRDTTRGYDSADIKKHLQNKVEEYVIQGKQSLVILFHDIDYHTYSGDNLHAYITVIAGAIDAQGFDAVLKLSSAEMDKILANY